MHPTGWPSGPPDVKLRRAIAWIRAAPALASAQCCGHGSQPFQILSSISWISDSSSGSSLEIRLAGLDFDSYP